MTKEEAMAYVSTLSVEEVKELIAYMTELKRIKNNSPDRAAINQGQLPF